MQPATPQASATPAQPGRNNGGGMNEIETFYGLIESTSDALRVFELSRQGRLGRVRRRLHERERKLIRSGSVFVFDEQESGIKRWTDGRLWSPSRILGNFLIYRELERKSLLVGPATGSGSEKPAEMNLADIIPWLDEPVIPVRARLVPAGWSVQEDFDDGIDPSTLIPYALPGPPYGLPGAPLFASQTPGNIGSPSSALGPQSLQQLKSKKLLNNHKGRYVFKPDGLIKKTISARIDGHTHHLICYYNRKDFCQGHLGGVFDQRLMAELRKVAIPPDLVLQQNFRKPAAVECGVTIGALAMDRHLAQSSTHLPIPRVPVGPKRTAKRRHSIAGGVPKPRPATAYAFPDADVSALNASLLDTTWMPSLAAPPFASESDISFSDLATMQPTPLVEAELQSQGGGVSAMDLAKTMQPQAYSFSGLADLEGWPLAAIPASESHHQSLLAIEDPVLPCVRPASNPSFAPSGLIN